MWRLLPALLLAVPLASADRETVLFDTDSGVFGDDGTALVMLMRSPEQVTVPGVSVVPGNVWALQGAEYMLHILDVLKRPEVPVYMGAEMPLVNSPALAAEEAKRWGRLSYTGAFRSDPAAVNPAPGAALTGRSPRREAAVQFLISEIERQPGQVTILAIGPMTNIALALRLKPDLDTKIKQIVFMGGAIKGGNSTPWAEFNFWFDPEAARMVLRSRIPKKVMFGLDICSTAPIRKADYDEIVAVQTPITDFYRQEFGRRFQRPDSTSVVWDALAAAYLIDPGYVTKSETRLLDVQTAWDQFYGAVVPLGAGMAPDATPVIVPTEVDVQRFAAIYKDRLSKRD